MDLLWVFAGGGLGSVLRFLVTDLADSRTSGAFPVGTFAVNLLGSLGLAFAAGILAHRGGRPELHLFLTTGLFGGFTTYSTFNLETLALIRRGSADLAALNVVLALVLCLLGGAVGLALASKV